MGSRTRDRIIRILVDLGRSFKSKLEKSIRFDDWRSSVMYGAELEKALQVLFSFKLSLK